MRDLKGLETPLESVELLSAEKCLSWNDMAQLHHVCLVLRRKQNQSAESDT